MWAGLTGSLLQVRHTEELSVATCTCMIAFVLTAIVFILGRALLPTPPGPPGKAPLDRRFSNDRMPTRQGREVEYEVLIDGAPLELTMGRAPRRIRIGSKFCMIQADKENREILVDGVCYYRVGEKTREVSIAGQKHTIAYQGPLTNIWIDELQVGYHT